MRHLTDIEIQKYLDRELNREEEIFLEKHLPGCYICQRKISDYQEIYKILNQPPEVDLPVNFVDKVLARIPDPKKHRWYAEYLDQILLGIALITGMIVYFYFVGVKSLLNLWENINPTIQNSAAIVMKYFENNPNHIQIIKYFMVALFILASIKLFDSFLFLRRRDISTS
jgi:hypothetical protein